MFIDEYHLTFLTRQNAKYKLIVALQLNTGFHSSPVCFNGVFIQQMCELTHTHTLTFRLDTNKDVYQQHYMCSGCYVEMF